MEFKLRVTRKQKDQRVRNMQEQGRVRVKVRGRKRWILPTKKEA